MGAIFITPERDAVNRGKAWAMPINGIDPTGADDHFVHIHNKTDKALELVRGRLSSTVAGMVELLRGTGTSSSSTAVPLLPMGVNKDTPGGGSLFETGANLQLTGDGAALTHDYLAADVARDIDYGIRIPANGQVYLNWTVATGVLSGFLIITQPPEDEQS